MTTKKVQQHEEDESQDKTYRPLFLGHWKNYLMLIFTLISTVTLGILFFSILFIIVVVATVGLGFHFWWLRRQLMKVMIMENTGDTLENINAVEGEYTVIEKI